MIDLPKRRVRYSDERDEILRDHHAAGAHPRMSHATSLWIGIASLAVGAGTAYYGAQQQKKAVNSANNANASLQQNQNDQSWTNYLATRGISPTTPVLAGQMPSAGGYTAINTRLPLWAGIVAKPANNGGSFLRKKGEPSSYALATPALGGYTPASVTPQSTGGGGSTGDLLKKATKDHLAIIDPIQGLKRLFG